MSGGISQKKLHLPFPPPQLKKKTFSTFFINVSTTFRINFILIQFNIYI